MSKIETTEPRSDLDKGKALMTDKICDMLGIENHEDLYAAVERITRAAMTPPHNISIVWNPEIPNSLSYRVMGVMATIEGVQNAAQVCAMVNQELTNKAIELAQQTTEDKIIDNESREADSRREAD